MSEVRIGGAVVGDGHPCYVIAEIGINHNGDLDIAKKIIDVAEAAGCNAVKFQKRNPDTWLLADQHDIPRETPWGVIRNIEYRRKLELGLAEFREIDRYCRELGITWFASGWDAESVDFLEQFSIPCYKIAAASLTDDDLLRRTRAKGKPVILSTGMSTLEQVDHAVEVLGKKDLILLHCCSAYPAHYAELNLRVIPTLRERYGVPVGYSGHETGLPSSVAAVALGGCIVERHITLDRSMWGSDQAASLEPNGITRLVRDIRLVEEAMGSSEKRLLPREEPIMRKLRRVGQ
jgi:N-acetylneuraminate synthase